MADNNAVTTIDADNQELSDLVAGMDNAKLASLLTPAAKPKGKKAPATVSGEPTTSLTHPKEEEAAAAKEDAKQAAAATAAKNTAAEEAQIKEVQNSPWTQLSNALTNEYQQEETPVAAAISGSTGNAAEAGAANQALASLGLSSSSPAGQWLSSQTAAADATAAPVENAMAQEGAQYASEQGPITKALQAYGQANALDVQTAPEASWLNALSSHITSNLSYEGVVPTAALSSLSPSVATALQKSGGYLGTSGAGTTPLQNIGANATDTGSKAIANASAALTSSGTSGTTVPPPASSPGG